MSLENYIRDIQDFPKEGILFKDTTPLLNNAEGTQECLQILVKSLNGHQINKVVGAESRGLLLLTF